MSKPVKEMIVSEYQKRFGDIDGALVLEIRSLPANDNNALRLGLLKKNIRVTVVKNTLARKAFAGTHLEAVSPALEGPSALAYGTDSVVNVARELVDWAKKVKDLVLKGAVLDGQYFEGEAGVKRLSDFPTKEEAQARVVSLILAPAGNVVRAATSPGSNILGIVKEIQERLEKGETIARN
ncbi:MAG TPA: 50S ribosomal protein L10 [Phycisphaerales bacterium]|nr:50S ribosomal protein L10 [Phycisphaerales bacterium]